LQYGRQGVQTIEAELHVPMATAQIVSFVTHEPSEGVIAEEDAYRLDLALSPRPANASACYCDRWRPDRFERVGDLFLLPLGEAMHGRGGIGRTHSIVQRLHADAVRLWLESDLVWTERKLEDCINLDNKRIRTLLRRLAHEVSHPGFGSDAMAELIAGQVAIELARHCRALRDEPASGGLAPWRLRLIDERLDDSCDTPTLAELARICSISGRQLTRGFRASKGCSIGDYIAARRIDHAKLALSADRSVKAIAHDLGFKSPSSFCYAFRRATGETPGQYQKRALTL